MDAMAVGSVTSLPFIIVFFAWVYMWFKRNERFDEEVMLDCAWRSGGAQSEAMIREELGTLSTTGRHASVTAFATAAEAWPATSRHAARATQR